MSNKARTPWFPKYSDAQVLYPLLVNVQVADYRQMQDVIGKQMGTNEHPVDWTQPDEWIQERLAGTEQQLASRLWEDSRHAINPRYISGSEFLARNYGLLDFSGETIQLTNDGQAFVTGKPQVLRRIDEGEGLVALLGLLGSLGAVQRKQLLPEWMAFLLANSATKSEAAGSSKLYDRLVNLLDRKLVAKDGLKYQLTAEGKSYLGAVEPLDMRRQISARRQMQDALDAYIAEQRHELKTRLGAMKPYRFEKLIRELLIAMKYEEAAVTQQSGDLGVDVLATARFGITTVKEVVQVKRTPGNISRPVVDQLRGVLPLHGAIRGTVITLGRFSEGVQKVAAFPGAAPITLIDGDTLLDLMIEHHVGVTPINLPVQPFSLNEQTFSEEDLTPEEEAVTA